MIDHTHARHATAMYYNSAHMWRSPEPLHIYDYIGVVCAWPDEPGVAGVRIPIIMVQSEIDELITQHRDSINWPPVVSETYLDALLMPQIARMMIEDNISIPTNAFDETMVDIIEHME
jgi:hypothetical protein